MDRPKRAALISEHATPVALLGGEDAGGQNVYVDEVARHLAANGYAVDVFTRRDAPELPEVVDWAPGVRVVNLTAGPATFLPKDALWPLMPAFRDAAIHFAAREGARYDVLHGNFWMSGWVATELSRHLGAPVVQIFHALGQTKRRYQGEDDSSPPERIAAERDIVRQADALIAQCPSERDELIEDYGADAGRIAVIPSGVDVRKFRPEPRAAARRRIGLTVDGLVVVYVGRMVPRKDVANAIRALGVLARSHERPAARGRSPATLLVVGGATEDADPVATPEIGRLQALANALGVAGQVRFVGKRQPSVLRHYYSAGDVVVTTPWYEPYGLTPLEAMACGRPVIGSAVGGIAFTVRDGTTGFLVPPSDPEALAARLDQVAAAPALARRMGRAARRRVVAHFSWTVTAQQTAALYETVCAAGLPVLGRSA